MRSSALALALLLPPSVAQADERPFRPNAVQLDLGLGVIGLAYERFFDSHVALQVEGHVFGTWFGPIVDLPRLSGFGGQLRPSIFFSGEGPRGVYLAPFLRVNRVEAESGGSTGPGTGYSTGAWLGYAFLFGERFNLRIGAGLQYMRYVVDVSRPASGGSATTKEIRFDTPFPALDLVTGFLF